MSSRLPPPPPPKPPRLQVRHFRQAASLPIDAVTLPREAMESTEYLDVQKKIISKQEEGADEVDRVADSTTIRAEPAQVDNKNDSVVATRLDMDDDESDESPEVQLVDMQIDDDPNSDHIEGETEDEAIASDTIESDKDDDASCSEYFDVNQPKSRLDLNTEQPLPVDGISEQEDEDDSQDESETDDIPTATGSKSKLFEIEDAKLLDHLRMRNPELLPKLIKMHLLMLLDLNGDTFASIFEEGNSSAEEGKRTGTIKRRKHESKNQDKCNVNISESNLIF
jgi:hypothetical protein